MVPIVFLVALLLKTHHLYGVRHCVERYLTKKSTSSHLNKKTCEKRANCTTDNTLHSNSLLSPKVMRELTTKCNQLKKLETDTPNTSKLKKIGKAKKTLPTNFSKNKA